MKSKKNKSKDEVKKISKLNKLTKDYKDKFKKPINSFSKVPRITDDTVGEHREEVLGSARKYIYPLRHSKHHLVGISIGILVSVLVFFFVYCSLELYEFQSTSGFIYSVTEVVPFPVAKAGNSWVSYYSYLFELRRNMHYYETQQQANFSSESGKAQLTSLKKQALAQVINDAYIKQLAKSNNVKVTNTDIDTQVAIVKQQNKLGSSNEVFDNVLKEYWGWNENDFRQELGQQLLRQKVTQSLDSSTDSKASLVFSKLANGGDFTALAAQYSDDSSTKNSGGQYPTAITSDTTALSPQVIYELFKLNSGQTSAVINTGYSLEILKVNSKSDNSVQASHIQFNLKSVDKSLAAVKLKNPTTNYITP